MARIKVSPVQNILFSTTIEVRITDLNYGNHLGNDRLLSILHEARVQFLTSLGYSEMNIENVGIIMADVAIAYKNQAFYGEQLKINIGIQDVTRVSFDFLYEIWKKVDHEENEVLVAQAKTGIVTFDYQHNKVVPIPQAFLEKLVQN